MINVIHSQVFWPLAVNCVSVYCFHRHQEGGVGGGMMAAWLNSGERQRIVHSVVSSRVRAAVWTER